MAYEVQRIRHGWRIVTDALTIDAEHPQHTRGTIRVTLSVYAEGRLAYRDAVTLTSERARARVLNRIGQKGIALDERVLIALDEACRRGQPELTTQTSGAMPEAPPDGADVLTAVEGFIRRYVALPSEHAYVAMTLWAAHAHALEAAESTPRLAFLSPEPECGKTRALEVLELLVPRPMLAVNATPAALFRAVADQANRPTILFDEIDTIFGPKAKENEELRGLLNAGHRRSGVAYRCVGEGTQQEVRAFPAYAAVALAGIGDLPDTLLSRSIVIPMRRRRPDEPVAPFRRRDAEREGGGLRDMLAAWARAVADRLAAIPEMPEGVTDRAADIWEPLLAVADAAGGEWPERARAAAVALLAQKREREPSLGIRLLADIRSIFEAMQVEALPTATLLEQLWRLEEAPWSNLRGRPLDACELAKRLREYGIAPKTIRVGKTTLRGYERGAFLDAWERYLPARVVAPSATEAQHPQHAHQGASAVQHPVADTVADEDGRDGLIRNNGWEPQHDNRMRIHGVARVTAVAGVRRGVQQDIGDGQPLLALRERVPAFPARESAHEDTVETLDAVAQRLLGYGDRVGWPVYAQRLCEAERVPLEIGLACLQHLVERGELMTQHGEPTVMAHSVLLRPAERRRPRG